MVVRTHCDTWRSADGTTHLDDNVERPTQNAVEQQVRKGNCEEHQRPEVPLTNSLSTAQLKDLECLRKDDSLCRESTTCRRLDMLAKEPLHDNTHRQGCIWESLVRTNPTASAALSLEATDTKRECIP